MRREKGDMTNGASAHIYIISRNTFLQLPCCELNLQAGTAFVVDTAGAAPIAVMLMLTINCNPVRPLKNVPVTKWSIPNLQ
jgi:hypothetical protein